MYKTHKRSVYAVDFDGTLCENKYPRIGRPNKRVINYLKKLKIKGHYLVLWTCREGDLLKEAMKWCADQDLIFHEYNRNIAVRIQQYGTDPRKICADYYIDDKAIKPSWWMR